MRRRDALLIPAALALPALSRSAAAQGAFPDRSVKLVVPVTPGGSNDIIARLVAETMGQRLGQSVVIENRSGAGGVLGGDYVAKSAPDGYTLLFAGSGSLVIASLVQRNVPYDIIRSFASIGFVGASPNVMCVNPGVPARNLEELRETGRRARTPLSYGSSGVGTTGHALGAMMALELGIDMTHVPYRGSAPAMNDVIAGRVDIITNAVAPLQPHLAAGKLRALGVAAQRRLRQVPEVPTSVEQGFPRLISATWYGVFAPAGTPAPVIERLHGALNAALADPETRRKIEENGCDVEPSASPADLARYVEEDRDRWLDVVRRADMKAE
jgi:tripartite-type tricarboxylate transporter receptor subunit TctC